MGRDDGFYVKTDTDVPTIIMEPTCHLRWMFKRKAGTDAHSHIDYGEKVLMQAWQCARTGRIEWREIEGG